MKRSKFLVISTSLVISMLAFSSCSKKSATYANPVSYNASLKVQSSRASEAEAAEFYEEDFDNTASPDYQRKLIKTGSINLEIDSLAEIDSRMETFAKQFGGYITNSSSYEKSFNATVKVPAGKFEQAMAAAGDIGKVKNRSINSEDVTETFYDLETRLETKKTMQKKLESYLASAKDMKDLLEIEKQLNNITTEIESMEGRMKRLSNQIDYSTIYFSVSLPTGYVESGFDWPDLGEDFKEFGYNVVSFAAGLLIVIFYIIIFGIPIIAVAAFFFWLLFGRVGLLIRLFKFLKWKK